MKLEVIRLGTTCRDTATGLAGMLTHLQIEQDHRTWYNFQPAGLNPETGQPVDRFWIVPDRLFGKLEFRMVDLPLEVLGTEVEDEASGFKGRATAVILHISGCVHIQVQPEGRLAKTGGAIAATDFDLRRLKGKSIKDLTVEERDESESRNPSPSPADRCGPAPL